MEKSLELITLFQKGLRPELRFNTDARYAEVFKGLRPGRDEARLPDRIVMSLTAVLLSDASITMAMPAFPQILESHGEFMVAEEDTLYALPAFVKGEWPSTVTAITTKDPFDPTTPKAIVSGGGRWDYVQIGMPRDKTQYAVIQNEKNMVFFHGLLDATEYVVFTTADGKIPRSITYHKGRFIRTGWSAPFGSGETFSSDWKAIFQEWMSNAGDSTGWGWDPNQSGQDHFTFPQPNWVFYSTVGEDDYIYHMMPGGLKPVMKEGLDPSIDLSEGSTIHYGLNLFTDPAFKVNPITGIGPVGRVDVQLGWKWHQGWSSDIEVVPDATLLDTMNFPAGPAIELSLVAGTPITSPAYFELIPAAMLTPFVSGNSYHIEFVYSFKLDENHIIRAELGGTEIWTRTVTAGEAATRIGIHEQKVSGVFTAGAIVSRILSNITLEIGFDTPGQSVGAHEFFRVHSIIVREELTTPYDIVRNEPENDYFMLEQIKRNQAGFLIMPFGGEALKVKNLNEFVMVYGEDGVAALKHHNNGGLALSYMGVEEQVWGSGCAGRESITGDENQHFWIDAIGNLWSIDSQLQSRRLGFKEFLAPLMPVITGASTSNPIMSFDEFERRVYISGQEADATHKTYVYDSIEDNFYETGQKVSTIHNNGNMLTGIVEDQSNFGAIKVTTNILDFGYRGLKELNPTEITSERVKNGTLDVSFNTDTETRFLTGELIGNGFGVHYNRASGKEFQFIYTGDSFQDVLTDGTFTNAGDWTIGGNWTVGSGQASHTGADAGNLVSKASNIANVLVEGEIYLVEYDVDTSTGSVRVIIGGTNGIIRAKSGRLQERIIAGSGSNIEFEVVVGSFNATVDNVRVMLIGARVNSINLHYDEVDKRFRMSPSTKELIG